MRTVIMRTASCRERALKLVAIGILASSAFGCANAREGAVSGAAVGALSGLAIGSLTGDAGKGAAIGAVVGGVGGGVVGDQNRREAERTQQRYRSAERTRAERRETEADLDRQSLGRLEGSWDMVGWSEVVSGDRRQLRGTAVGAVHQAYYVTLDFRAAEDGGDPAEDVTGTLTFASVPGRGVTVESRTSNAPAPARFTGGTSADRSMFLLLEEGAGRRELQRRLSIRLIDADYWVIDVQNVAYSDEPLVGSFTFRRSR